MAAHGRADPSGFRLRRHGHAPGEVRSSRSHHWPCCWSSRCALRIVAADLVDLYVRRTGADRLCLFPDTRVYWELARTIRAGEPYQIVEWTDIPHFALPHAGLSAIPRRVPDRLR